MVARDFFEVLISYEFFSMTVLKVARKSIGERVKQTKYCSKSDDKNQSVGAIMPQSSSTCFAK